MVVICRCSIRAIFNQLPFTQLQCCHISSAYLEISIHEAKSVRLWIFKVLIEFVNILKNDIKIFMECASFKNLQSLPLSCIKDTTQAGIGTKDCKLDGGGETRQLTSLRAPCRHLPKSTHCPVTLQEQDGNRKVGNGCAQ